MKYFNLDLHISVIADIKNVIHSINPSIEIVNWSLSGHTWVFNKRIDAIKYINEHTWKYLNLHMIKEFQNHYDSFLSQFDGFIVAHPNSFVLLYEKYNKPIIMVNSCRYDMPFCFNKKCTYKMPNSWYSASGKNKTTLFVYLVTGVNFSIP